MASQAERLAELVAAGEAGLVAGLPRQLVHGDFWDDNVFFQGETLVFAADFAFMAERARIDDLALTLYYTDTRSRPDHKPGPDRRAAAAGARLRQRARQPAHRRRTPSFALGHRPAAAVGHRRLGSSAG